MAVQGESPQGMGPEREEKMRRKGKNRIFATSFIPQKAGLLSTFLLPYHPCSSVLRLFPEQSQNIKRGRNRKLTPVWVILQACSLPSELPVNLAEPSAGSGCEL